MNIILTGLRGSGKTKIGKLLAQKLKRNFIDIDEEVEKKEGKKISKIVELHGWEYFRAAESKMTKEIANLNQTIIATGGGTILDKENKESLKKNGKFIYLYVKPEVCAERIKNDRNRPKMVDAETAEEEMKRLYKERNGIYCQSAFMVFERTDNAQNDVKEIIEKLNIN